MLLLRPHPLPAPALRPRPAARRPPPRARRRPPRPRASASTYNSEEDAFTRCSGYLFEEGRLASEGELPTAYHMHGIATVYHRRPLLVLRRSLQIGASFGRWIALRYLDGVNDRADDMFECRSMIAHRMDADVTS